MGTGGVSARSPTPARLPPLPSRAAVFLSPPFQLPRAPSSRRPRAPAAPPLPSPSRRAAQPYKRVPGPGAAAAGRRQLCGAGAARRTERAPRPSRAKRRPPPASPPPSGRSPAGPAPGPPPPCPARAPCHRLRDPARRAGAAAQFPAAAPPPSRAPPSRLRDTGPPPAPARHHVGEECGGSGRAERQGPEGEKGEGGGEGEPERAKERSGGGRGEWS